MLDRGVRRLIHLGPLHAMASVTGAQCTEEAWEPQVWELSTVQGYMSGSERARPEVPLVKDEDTN